MNYIALALLSIAAIIVLAAIFSRNFQEKIFGGDGSETKIAGIITVQGVSFVVLIVALAGIATYLEIEIQKKPKTDTDINNVLDFLEKENSSLITLDFPYSDSVDVKLNNRQIARIEWPSMDFSINKSDSFTDKYDLNIKENYIGDFKLDILENALNYKKGNIYFQDSAYNFPNTNFWFKIESIEEIATQEDKIARYTFRFGEGESDQNIKWSGRKIEYGKSDNGQIPNRMKLLKNTDWVNSYAIALGAGLFGEIEDKNYIEMINATLVIIKVEK